MTATQIHGKIQFVDTNGVPLSGGKVYTYLPGTTTDKASYTVPDATGGTENTQPVILDSRGEADIYVIGDCKIKVTDSLDNLIYTLDNVEDLKYVVTTSYIPYIGATTNVDLGSKTLATTGAVSTGALTTTTSGSIASYIITDTGANGANLKLAGDGATTPNKYIRSKGGNLEFVNSAYTDVIATLSDSGVFLVTGSLAATTTLKTGGYTVATLPAAGTAGRRAYVTDATAPTFLGALVGGGAVVCPVFDNGSAWVSG